MQFTPSSESFIPSIVVDFSDHDHESLIVSLPNPPFISQHHLTIQTRSAHSDVASLKAELALVRSSSIQMRGQMATDLEDARQGIDAVLVERRRLEEAWRGEKETLLRKEEDLQCRLEESDKRVKEWEDSESSRKDKVRDLERNLDERLAAELEKKEREVRLEEEEKK